jgi:predicted HicB family RNase H-like nuclease
MSDTMEYRGYHTRVDYDADEDSFVGEVLGIKDLIVFSGESIEEFRKAFHESVDSYLDMCERHGKKPDKEYSGQFVFRAAPEIHRQLAITAEKQGVSLNTLIIEACKRHIGVL